VTQNFCKVIELQCGHYSILHSHAHASEIRDKERKSASSSSIPSKLVQSAHKCPVTSGDAETLRKLMKLPEATPSSVVIHEYKESLRRQCRMQKPFGWTVENEFVISEIRSQKLEKQLFTLMTCDKLDSDTLAIAMEQVRLQ
jgi:hypothetical protein